MAALASIIAPILGQLVSVAVGISFIFILGALSANLLVPFINSCGDALTNWVTIPVVNQVILWGQLVAVVIAVSIRVVIGIKENVFADGGPRQVSLGEYVFKSFCSIVLVGLMPVICVVVMQFGSMMFNDVVLGAGGSSRLLANVRLNADWVALFALLDAKDPVSLIVDSLMANIVLIVAFALCVICIFQMLKRQFQMLVLGAVGPWVGIKAATNTDSSQYWDFVVSLFGMCVTQWAQYLFLMIDINMLVSFLGGSPDLFGSPLFTGPSNYVSAFILLAAFGATISIPHLLDRYAFIGGGGGAGGMAVGVLLRGSASVGSRLAGRAGSALGRASSSGPGK